MRIGICGNLASGKTTLARMLGNHYGVVPFFEAIDRHTYLTDFYKDMKKWAFHSQIRFLAQSLEQYNDILEMSGAIIQDGVIYEQEVYTKNLYEEGIMSERDYKTYRLLYENTVKIMEPPDQLIYLEYPTDVLMERIHKRARGCEVTVTAEYVEQLNVLYKEWIKDFDLCPNVLKAFKPSEIHTLLVDKERIAYYL